MVYTANWGIICHLPPFRATRNNHWPWGVLVLIYKGIPEAYWISRQKFNSKTLKVKLLVRLKSKLVGGFNPFEKYARQNGFIFPNFRDEHKEYLSCHHLVKHHESSQKIGWLRVFSGTMNAQVWLKKIAKKSPCRFMIPLGCPGTEVRING